VPRRTNKFYRKNESSLMKSLGLNPTPNSGSGWLVKEDGQNDFLIAQLKSTDANSIGVSLSDIKILEYNAATAHKVPTFIIQFIGTNDVFVVARPDDIPAIAQYINCGECKRPTAEFIDMKEKKPKPPEKIVSSGDRDSFWQEKEEERKKWRKK
jgi:hypothetical protein